MVRDLTGQPVIEGSSVYLASSVGRMAAVDLNTGLRIWTAKQGSQGHIPVSYTHLTLPTILLV